MSFVVISSSLNPGSRSNILAREAFRQLSENHKTEWIDLREYELPLCDGNAAYGHPNVKELGKKLAEATCILLAVPIYNFDCGAAAKNLIELTGRSWEDKTVGFLCAAGGRSSYMSIMSVANSLMLDFRCLIIPRFVYADGSAFEGGAITDPEIRLRVEQLVESAVRLNGASIPKVAASK
ncbi:MAG TPA: NAD(P)H-dependent oxidoreductase [Planktothrix sp.]|jgi:FMN reductase